MVKMITVQAAQISHFDGFKQIPDAFIGIEVWRIGRQLFQMNGWRTAFRQEGLDLITAMNRRPIPDRQQSRAPVALHLFEKLHTLYPVSAWVRTKVAN